MGKGIWTLVAVGLLGFAVPAVASTIEFRHVGLASGSLGGITFSNSEYEIRALGETADRYGLDVGGAFLGYAINHTSASIKIKGVGQADFLTETRTVSNWTIGAVEFGRIGTNYIDGLGLIAGPFIGYQYPDWDMLSSVKEISTVAFISQWGEPYPPVMTSLGQLIFVDDDPPLGTSFWAIRRGVPEPGTLGLLGLGLAGLGFVRRGRTGTTA